MCGSRSSATTDIQHTQPPAGLCGLSLKCVNISGKCVVTRLSQVVALRPLRIDAESSVASCPNDQHIVHGCHFASKKGALTNWIKDADCANRPVPQTSAIEELNWSLSMAGRSPFI